MRELRAGPGRAGRWPLERRTGCVVVATGRCAERLPGDLAAPGPGRRQPGLRCRRQLVRRRGRRASGFRSHLAGAVPELSGALPDHPFGGPHRSPPAVPARRSPDPGAVAATGNQRCQSVAPGAGCRRSAAAARRLARNPGPAPRRVAGRAAPAGAGVWFWRFILCRIAVRGNRF